MLTNAGIEVVLSGERIPRVNSITERWVQTCRHELLDRTLIWNHRHLLRALREFEQFCNETSGSRILKVDWKRTCWSWPAVEGVGTRVERCLNAPVIELVGLFVAAGLTGWLFRRKAKQRAVSAAQGNVIKVPCMLGHPSLAGRWLRGRMLIGPSTMAWEPRTRAGAAIALPAELRQVSLRSPSLREAMKINGGSRIVECTSSEGAVLIAVMPNELDHVLTALSRNGAE
jgi:hypothetical protein